MPGTNQLSDAQALDSAAVVIETSNERFHEPEVLLWWDRPSSAMTMPRRGNISSWSIALSRKRGTRAGVRSTMTLAQLLARTGQAVEGRDRLTEVYGRFSEGFGTPDMVAARELSKGMCGSECDATETEPAAGSGFGEGQVVRIELCAIPCTPRVFSLSAHPNKSVKLRWQEPGHGFRERRLRQLRAHRRPGAAPRVRPAGSPASIAPSGPPRPAAWEGSADLAGSEAAGQRCLRRPSGRSAASRGRPRVGPLAALRQFRMVSARAERIPGRRGGRGLGSRDKLRVFKVVKTPIPAIRRRRIASGVARLRILHVDPRAAACASWISARRSRRRRPSGCSCPSSTTSPTTSRTCCISRDGRRSRRRAGQPRREGPRLHRRSHSDLKPQRDALRRALQQHGYTVLPARTLPLVEGELAAAVREDLAACRMSIHMFGGNYGMVPEGAEPRFGIQSDLAAERSSGRLLPPAVDSAGPLGHRRSTAPAAAAAAARSRDAAGHGSARNLLRRSQDARHGATDEAPSPARSAAPAKPGTASLYLVYDQRDEAAVAPWDAAVPVVRGRRSALRRRRARSARGT